MTVSRGLGDPYRLAASTSGRPNYLIGPELFPHYRRLLVLLLSIVVPVVGALMGVLELVGGGQIGSAIVRGGEAALNVAVHTSFWITLVFALLERADAAKQAAGTQAAGLGSWTLDQLPKLPTGRITVSEMAGEVLSLLITIGGLIVVQNLSWTDSDTGQVIPLIEPSMVGWLPLLILALASLLVLHVVVYRVGRCTMQLASVHALLELAFALPVVWLALNGMLVNPAFAAEIGWPPLAEGDGPVMLVVAAGVAVVTAWEIFDAFRRSRRSLERA